MLATRAVGRIAANSRNMSVIASPPQVRISFAEKLCHGVAIAAGCLTIPAWVLLHLKQYKGQS